MTTVFPLSRASMPEVPAASGLLAGLEALCRVATSSLGVAWAVVWREGEAPIIAGREADAARSGALTAYARQRLAGGALEQAAGAPDDVSADAGDMASWASSPLIGDGRTIGLLIVQHPEARVLTGAEQALLADLALAASHLIALATMASDAADQRDFYRLLTEHSTDTIVRGDLNGVRLYISPACRDLLGYEPAELEGRRAMEIVHPDDLASFAEVMADVRAGRICSARSEQRQRHKDGHWVWMEAFIRLTRDPHTGEPDGYVVSVRDISQRKAAEQRLAHLAAHDGLTALANRSLLQERLEAELARARRTGQGLAVLCLDLDRFKRVNDSLGHAAGDAVLCAVASRLKAATRVDDLVARVGGDEFVVVQAVDPEPTTGAERLASRLIQLIARPVDVHGAAVVVGLSVGIAVVRADQVARGISTGTVLRAGDQALYAAKAAGRGRYLLADLSQIPWAADPSERS